MKAIPCWRAIGAAMRWARQQKDVRRSVIRDDETGRLIEMAWDRDGYTDLVAIAWTPDGGPHLYVNLDDQRHLQAEEFDAATTLRVLAAMGLIPAHLVELLDERYGRCAKCDRLARWWNDKLAPRWVHAQPWAVTGPAAHMAEVDA
ncbi:hypothetical protein Ait01nite_089820 [Actinoplanes italicus]|uniref:Uncharacterized protein n=1 Tax=Actinoplanes italicus TaxID=113567 RepID=A0A2T0JIU9_9ACTN|nr:hypothetical protein [Actinoplanes italicus]PRX07399.1 hypothetical protein CLV67_14274 [Actinoplanes italicus]GIE35937.1 hypothetical protein Ait01nite_089820 [Actinoplanes italicus]